MKKKIAILGSTGSIGKTTFNIVKNNSKDFNVVLLTTNKNINEIYKQAKLLKVKNIIVTSKDHYEKAKKKINKKNIKIYNNLDVINKIFKKNEIDYTMSAITGLVGLKPTLDIIGHTKTIAIANKESIICGWNLIKKKLKKHNAKFIPVDSEHFSIWNLIKNHKKNEIDEIIITASGGPFLKRSLASIKNVKPSEAIKHPKWKMGKKISIDSATMMNKVFEVIEAQRIFDVDIKKFKILIHPNSYIHAIIKFNNGLIKILAHDTDMRIPIFNSIYHSISKKVRTSKLNLSKLNNLELKRPNQNKFPSLKLLKKITNNNTLFECVLITANDQLVNYFLSKKIGFNEIIINLNKLLNLREFSRYLKIKPSSLNQINRVKEEVRLKTMNLCIK